MYDARNKLSIQVEEDVREVKGKAVYKTIIPEILKFLNLLPMESLFFCMITPVSAQKLM